MAVVVLPEHLREDFAPLAESIQSVFPAGLVALGGGSLLESLWSHRVSTDLDLFVAPRNLAAAHDAGGGFSLFYPNLVASLRINGLSMDARVTTRRREQIFIKGECPRGTPWSIAEMPYANPDQPMMDSMEGSGIRTGSITEVFMGKIVGRAHAADKSRSTEPIPIRDCYDICVCSVLEPDILDRVVNVIPDEARARIVENLRNAPDDLHERDKKALTDPKWEVDLRGVASRIGEAIESRDIARMPTASPRAMGNDGDPSEGLIHVPR